MMVKLSIIVPVYQAELYIEECLRSLLQQKMNQYEILCIDDGSNDHSGNIIREMCSKHPEIHYFYQKNQGVSAARNYGLRVAAGDYILFVDADDFLRQNKVRALLKKAERTQADILVFGGHTDRIFSTPEWVKDAFFTRNRIYNGRSLEALFGESGSKPSVCNKLFSRRILQGCFFPEDVVVSEDLAFLFQIFPNAERVVYCSDDVYRYRISNEMSAMHVIDGQSVISFENHLKTLEYILEQWKQKEILGRMKSEVREWMFSFLDYLYIDLTETQKKVFHHRLEDIFQQLDVIPGKGFQRLEKKRNPEKMSFRKFLRSGKYQIERYGFYYGMESFLVKIYTYLKNRM